VIWRGFAGVLIAGCIAFAAMRTRSLDRSGAVVATLVGALAVTAGWDWGALLLLYFVSSSMLSRVGRAAKERRTASIVEKTGARDAVQVLANGGVFAAASIAMLVRPDIRWFALGAGALAASASDTWATEIGTLWGGTPRSIVSWRAMPAGTSGAVSLIGSMGAVAGAAFMAAIVMLLGWESSVAGRIAAGGVSGAAIDTLLGATVQARRWCDRCEQETERRTHDCGTTTRALRGLGWLDNDLVNFLSTVGGGLVSVVLSR
jgi:uncharacterized protein (TIGR00297 family)